MSREAERKDTIKEAILLAKNSSSATSQKSMAMLYALADKFLEKKELEEIKEVISMTRIGQMLLEEGMEKGRAQGIEKMAELTEKLLDAGRTEDIRRAAKDKAYREKLMKEYQLL